MIFQPSNDPDFDQFRTGTIYSGSLTLRVLLDGDLQISVPAGTQEDLRQWIAGRSLDDRDYQICEDIGCNSEIEFYADADHAWPEIKVGLTNAPIFVLPYWIDGDNYPRVLDWDRSLVWWFPGYQIDDWIQTLIATGEVLFKAA